MVDAAPSAIPKEIADIFRVLRTRIVTRKITPGTRLREQDLALEFEVSRARIREVLVFLEQRELLSRQANKGVVVRRFSLEELLMRFEIFECLSGLATRLATQQSDPKLWREWRELLNGPVSQMVTDGNLHDYLENISQCQRQIWKAANNEPLAALLLQHLDTLGPYMQKALMVSDHAQLAEGQHAAVLKAMEEGHAERAEQLRREQLRSSRATLEKFHDLLM